MRKKRTEGASAGKRRGWGTERKIRELQNKRLENRGMGDERKKEEEREKAKNTTNIRQKMRHEAGRAPNGDA